ncbi:MAG: hypothetical protein U1E87_08415 [Alphaproteobacteria bacterium]
MPKATKASDKKSAGKSAKAGTPKTSAKSPAKSAKIAKPAASKPAPAKGKPAPKPSVTKKETSIHVDLPLPGLGSSAMGSALPGLGAASGSTAIPGFQAPQKTEAKGPVPLAPGKGYDPKGAEWRNRHGHGQVSGGPPPSRPFKGGGRGR